MATNTNKIYSNSEDIFLEDGSKQTFKIDAEELIKSLENIGDYKGITEVENDIDSLSKK